MTEPNVKKALESLELKKFRGTWQNSSENTNRWCRDLKQANDNKNEIDFQRKTNSRTMEKVIYRASNHNQIEYDWLNKSLNRFKILCKSKFLTWQWVWKPIDKTDPKMLWDDDYFLAVKHFTLK